MKKITRTILAILLPALMVVSVNAQKFGYINTQELIQQIPEVKEANANIETYKSQLQKRGTEMVTALQTKYQSLEQKQQNGEMSPKALEVEAQKLEQERMNIAKFEQESQQKIMTKSESLLKPIRDKIQTAIDAVAKEQSFDYIFDGSMGIILFADPSADVSAQVKAKLGM